MEYGESLSSNKWTIRTNQGEQHKNSCITNDWFNDYPFAGVDLSKSKEKVSSNEDKNIV